MSAPIGYALDVDIRKLVYNAHELERKAVWEHLKPFRVSASQIKTYLDCPRKWAWDKMFGAPRTESMFTEFGKRVHSILEDWFREGTPPPNTPEGLVARNILSHLPPPQTHGIVIEGEINLLVDDVPLLGYVDFAIYDQDIPLISDHKTTGNLRWALTPDTMAADVQCALYAVYAMLYTGKDKVQVQWTYGTRKGDKSLPVKKILTLDDIQPTLSKIRVAVKAMRALYHSGLGAIEIPDNTDSCAKYGGCQFDNAQYCADNPKKALMRIMSNTVKNDFLSRLKEQTNTPTVHADPAPKASDAPTATTSGVINPPSAPEIADPEPQPNKPKDNKESSPRRSKMSQAADADAAKDELSAAKDKAAKDKAAAQRPLSCGLEPAGFGTEHHQKGIVDKLCSRYAQGYSDGFATAIQLIRGASN